jgi:GlpG protein
MRQLAVFESAEQARRLAAYLVTLRITAHAEQEDGGHSVWVRDEDQMEQARQELGRFRENPSDPKYDGVESAATLLRLKQEAEQAARQKNVVEMRGRWGSGAGIRRKCPLTIGLIVVSVLVALATNQLFEDNGANPSSLLDSLRFVRSAETLDNFADVKRGQVWRLVTPIFVHYGIMHLVFNMWLMYVLGGQIEDRLGSGKFAAFVLLAAILSNLGQAITAQSLGKLGLFGGMSGVGYAVFGYLWMKVKFDPGSGFQLDKLNVFILMAWLVLCTLREFPPFDSVLGMLPKAANTAHVVGLVVGMAAGYAPLLIKGRR